MNQISSSEIYMLFESKRDHLNQNKVFESKHVNLNQNRLFERKQFLLVWIKTVHGILKQNMVFESTLVFWIKTWAFESKHLHCLKTGYLKENNIGSLNQNSSWYFETKHGIWINIGILNQNLGIWIKTFKLHQNMLNVVLDSIWTYIDST